MSRQPVQIERSGGKSQRQRVWEAIRRFEHADPARSWAFSVDMVSRSSKVEEAPVREYLKSLEAAGYLRHIAAIKEGGRVKSFWRLAQDNGVEAPRVRRDGSAVTQGRGTESMWSVMTTIDSFTFHFLAELAGVKPATAATYCSVLGKAGYLEVLKPGKGGIATVWTVARPHRDKPYAPMITRLKAVYDPNIHQLVWGESADAAADLVEIGGVVE